MTRTEASALVNDLRAQFDGLNLHAYLDGAELVLAGGQRNDRQPWQTSTREAALAAWDRYLLGHGVEAVERAPWPAEIAPAVVWA